jgi:hypothetical protein
LLIRQILEARYEGVAQQITEPKQMPKLAKITGVCAILDEGGLWHTLRAFV